MQMYDLIEYSYNHSHSMDSLWFYSKDETANFNVDNTNAVRFKSLDLKIFKVDY